MDERRKSARVLCDVPCLYDDAPSRASNRPETISRAITHDLSESGARLLVFDFIPVGQQIRVHLELPNTEPLETGFQVMWINEVPHADKRFEIGGRFTTLAEDQLAKIRQFICRLSLLPKR